MNNKLLVLGTIAYDSIESPSGSVKKILGGCATYIGLSASKFKTSCCLVSIVGEDFESSYFKLLELNGLDTWNQLNELSTLTELNELNKLNESSIKATVEDISKKNLGKYL